MILGIKSETINNSNLICLNYSSHLKRLSTLDTSWVVSAGSNGLAAHNSPAWLSLYLSVCKLLDLSLALPAQKLPQFQMYRWAFVSEGIETEASEAEVGKPERRQHLSNGNGADGGNPKGATLYQQQDFVPYVVRVAKLLLLRVSQININTS